MADIERYDHLLIGSGGANKFVAWTMTDARHRTAMVEHKAIGGACPNVACLPSKNIIHSAKVISLARRGDEFGLETESLRVDMTKVQRRKRLMVEDYHRSHIEKTKASGAELIIGHARFIAPRTVEIDLHAGKRTISGQRVFLDLGSHSVIPDIPGLAEADPMTHVEALDLDRLPQHLIVMGGGYVGLELSQAMRRFGSRVTLIEAGPQVVGREDSDVGAALKELFIDEGIDVLTGTEVRRVEGRSGDRVQIQIKSVNGQREIEGTDILVATGRRANTDRIGLELTGVQLDERGFVKVDERLRTTADDIWAMGDCAGSPMFTHVAYDDFSIVRENLNGGNRTTRNRVIPFCVFTDPELARIGLNETEARREGIEYRLARTEMLHVNRTQTMAETRGFMKMLIAKRSDEILGFTALGLEASELLAAVQVAMLGHMPYTSLRDAMFSHPTIAEGLNVLLADVPG